MIVRIYARFVGILIGSRFQVNVKPAANAPLASLGIGHLDSVHVTAIPNNNGPVPSSRDVALLPMQVASLTSSKEGVSLGWKSPALFLLLLLTWLKPPNYGGAGNLEGEAIVDADSL